MSKDYPTFVATIPDTQVEYLRCRTPPAVLCNSYRISQPSVVVEKEYTVHRMTERVSAHILDLKDAAVLDEILRWAKKQEVTELVALDEESVRHALMREVPNGRRCGDVVYRCGFCEARVLAGDNYCRCCGQRVR